MDPVISVHSDTELIMGDTNLNSGLSKTRIEALTDGIFAIAMTLMVFAACSLTAWTARSKRSWSRWIIETC